MANEKEKKTLSNDDVYSLIRNLLGQAHILTIPRVFINYTGDIPSALLLAQLIYWSERTIRADGYVWKTYREWEEELSLKKYLVSKAANTLKSMGILKTIVRKAGGNPTVHYLLEKEEFLKSFVQFLNKRKCQMPTKENEKIEQTSNIDYPHRLDSKITHKDDASREAGSIDSLGNQIVSEYFKAYEDVHGTPHPVLKEKQLQQVCSRLRAFANEYYCELEDFRTIIRAHFSRTDGLATDGNINHFATEGILKNLYFRHCYYADSEKGDGR